MYNYLVHNVDFVRELLPTLGLAVILALNTLYHLSYMAESLGLAFEVMREGHEPMLQQYYGMQWALPPRPLHA